MQPAHGFLDRGIELLRVKILARHAHQRVREWHAAGVDQHHRWREGYVVTLGESLGAQAVAGEMSVDDAIKRLTSDIDEQVKAASK